MNAFFHRTSRKPGGMSAPLPRRRAISNAARLALPLGLVALLCGCKLVGSLAVLLSPPQMQKPDFEPTTGRLAIFIDYARGVPSNPVFDVALYNRLDELFRNNKVPSELVPYEDVVQLRQSNPDFANWSVQKIGRELKAEQVLLIHVDQLRLRAAEGDPIMSPHVTLHLKVISVDKTADKSARVWPDKNTEPDGREVARDRQPKETDSVELIDAEATKLARETAYYVGRNFYKFDLEEKPPREP